MDITEIKNQNVESVEDKNGDLKITFANGVVLCAYDFNFSVKPTRDFNELSYRMFKESISDFTENEFFSLNELNEELDIQLSKEMLSKCFIVVKMDEWEIDMYIKIPVAVYRQSLDSEIQVERVNKLSDKDIQNENCYNFECFDLTEGKEPSDELVNFLLEHTMNQDMRLKGSL